MAGVNHAGEREAGPFQRADSILGETYAFVAFENRREVAAKVAQWIAAGTHAVVVLNPRTSVATVHRPNAEVVTLGVTDCLSLPDLLPGWSLALNEIFR